MQKIAKKNIIDRSRSWSQSTSIDKLFKSTCKSIDNTFIDKFSLDTNKLDEEDLERKEKLEEKSSEKDSKCEEELEEELDEEDLEQEENFEEKSSSNKSKIQQ